MSNQRFRLGRLQHKVPLLISVIVIVPMLVAGWLAAEWVSTAFEHRLEQWIRNAARANQNWLQAYLNDAVMLGRVLADDPTYIASLEEEAEGTLPESMRRISQELGINFVQIYTPQRELVASSIPVKMKPSWEHGQVEAVLKVVKNKKSMLAAIGITPLPRRGKPQYYLVMGSLLGHDFTSELEQLTGLKTRLYYREGKKYYDVFSSSGRTVELKHLSKTRLRRMEKSKAPFYDLFAEGGKFRGLYMPIVDSTGHVEAVMFSGLERGGMQELLTNRAMLLLAIALLGILIGGLTGWLLSRMVLRPLGYLRNGVMQLAGQNFKATVPLESNDEFGDLAKAFNAMAARLREARDEQAQRFQKDKLAAMGELSAALAHEIRNPIGVINASAALLEKAEQDPKKKMELVRMIREESMGVSNLVQDFLQLSRYRQPVFTSIDPVQPMERALNIGVATSNQLEITRNFNHGEAHILADAGLLQQAWTNVLTNAIEAMTDGSGELKLESRLENGEIILTVEDSGPGLDAEAMPRLFEPFFTTKEKGTGLGLTIANTLVEVNGGRLEALPPDKRGAKFAMCFPVHEKADL